MAAYGDLAGSSGPLATLARSPEAPFHAFAAVVDDAPAALPAANRIGARVVAGLGATEEDARLRTLAEATERSRATYHGDEPTVRRTPAKMGVAAKAAIDRVLQVSPFQQASRALWNLKHPGRHAVPPAVNPRMAVEWIQSTGDRPAWFPAGLVLLGHPDRLRAPWVHARTSGLAFGWTTEEALVRALLEVIERDVVAMWWYQRILRPKAAIAATGWMRAVDAWLVDQGRRLSFLDLTHDLRTPVVAAVSWTGTGRRPVIGTGAGLSLREAAEAALREHLLAMINLSLLEGTAERQGVAALDRDAALLLAWHQVTEAKRENWLTPADDAAPVAPARVAGSPDARRMRDDLIARLGQAGLTPMFFELRRDAPDAPVGAVVRVIVPSLRTTLARFGPGRLYEVPTRLGWVHPRRSEESLNPEPYLF